MTYSLSDAKEIPFSQVYLDLENPRHVPFETQDEVIEYLLKDEQVLQLAADIAKHGLNPLDLFAVVEYKKQGKKQLYTVAEGNRRLCAIKLLNDPDLAPGRKRKDFDRLSSNADFIPSNIPAIVFDSAEDGRLWIERLHGGQQGGIGRKTWNSDQKNRYTGNPKNALAQAVLDTAEEKGFISSDDRKGKLTTAQRYLDNAQMKEALGIDMSNPDGLSRTRPARDFNKLLQRFIIDLTNGEVHSRNNKEDIKAYAREIGTMEGIGNKRVTPTLIQDDTRRATKKKKIQSKRPTKRTRINHNEDIENALRSIPSHKLESIYNSLVTIKYTDHAPLLSVGLWVFMETLTALCGRSEGTDIVSFLSNEKLQKLGEGSKKEKQTIRGVMKRIAEHGNTTKHHHTSAAFNGEQLSNDVDTVTKIIIALAEDAREDK